MKTKNAITVRPGPDLPALKRAKSLVRLTESILGKSIAPARNRTDEQGRKQGYWVERSANGIVEEGPFVNGKKQGHWVLRFADGHVEEGPFVGGKKHGHWVLRFADGEVWEGPCVDGKWHGKWVHRFANGGVKRERCWENDNPIDC